MKCQDETVSTMVCMCHSISLHVDKNSTVYTTHVMLSGGTTVFQGTLEDHGRYSIKATGIPVAEETVSGALIWSHSAA